MNTHLLIIDPQNDFCDGPANGALAVVGAWNDMERLAHFIELRSDEINEITISLDSHHYLDIGHPAWWKLPDGSMPAPFSVVTAADIRSGKIVPSKKGMADYALTYLERIEANGRYVHTIWPPHCLVGTPGHNIQPTLMRALTEWSVKSKKQINYIFKGMNSNTEHYSAIRAEIPDPNDPTTDTNKNLLRFISSADRILVSGEALSHCVKATVEDIVERDREISGNDDIVKKITILKDTMNSVGAVPGGPDFPKIGDEFLDKMEKIGAHVTTTRNFR